MKFNIDKIFHRPSFYFLAYQGFLVFLTGISACFSYTYYGKWTFEDFFNTLGIIIITPFLWIVIELPFITLASLITSTFWSFIKKRNVLFSIPLTLINIILLGTFPLIDAYQTSKYSGSGLGFIVAIAIPFIPIVAILFTLIPYLILRYQEKKHNLVVENPPFTKEKIFHKPTIIGLYTYAIITICCTFHVILFFVISLFQGIYNRVSH